MFSLIIAIVSIALVVAIVAATMFHGGGMEKANVEAKAAGLMSQSQQILAATTFYRDANQGQSPANLEALAPDFLRTIPAGWTSVDGYVVTSVGNEISDEACLVYNKKRDVPLVPSCSDATYADKNVCCKAAD